MAGNQFPSIRTPACGNLARKLPILVDQDLPHENQAEGGKKSEKTRAFALLLRKRRLSPTLALPHHLFFEIPREQRKNYSFLFLSFVLFFPAFPFPCPFLSFFISILSSPLKRFHLSLPSLSPSHHLGKHHSSVGVIHVFKKNISRIKSS